MRLLSVDCLEIACGKRVDAGRKGNPGRRSEFALVPIQLLRNSSFDKFRAGHRPDQCLANLLT